MPTSRAGYGVEKLRKKLLPIDKWIKAILWVELALRFTHHSWGPFTTEAAADLQRTQMIMASETLGFSRLTEGRSP